MSPIIALTIWRTYVIPKFLYGIEIRTYTKTDLQKLERLQLKILKQFQGLSERTANVGAYSLLELEPIEAVIDRNTLSFLGGIIRNKSIIEFAILERELSISKTNGNLRNKSKQNTTEIQPSHALSIN
jgi:hypothetical protein